MDHGSTICVCDRNLPRWQNTSPLHRHNWFKLNTFHIRIVWSRSQTSTSFLTDTNKVKWKRRAWWLGVGTFLLTTVHPFTCPRACWSSRWDSTCRSSACRSGWPWRRRRHTRQLGTHDGDGGSFRSRPPDATRNDQPGAVVFVFNKRVFSFISNKKQVCSGVSPCSTWAQRAWPSFSCACSSWGWCKTSSSSS